MPPVEWIVPDLPRDWHDWVSIFVIVTMILFKIDRGNLLRTKSKVMDRLGASTIAYDYSQALVWSVAVLWFFYPELEKYTYIPVVCVLFGFLIWAWYEVRRASNRRISHVMGSSEDPRSETTDSP
jgi:protein-S-isoprenylcysteine O-methyltransferase Ste14